MELLTLGTTTLDLQPMTWGTQKKAFKILVKGLTQWDAAKLATKRWVNSLVHPATEPEGAPDPAVLLADLIGEIPELLTELLSVASGASQETLDNSTGTQVAKLLEAVIEVNDLAGQWASAKKTGALLSPAKQQGL